MWYSCEGNIRMSAQTTILQNYFEIYVFKITATFFNFNFNFKIVYLT